jgi:exopolysaccharide production protein ExoY
MSQISSEGVENSGDADAQESLRQSILGDPALERRLAASRNKPGFFTGTGMSDVASDRIPAWKRAFDIAFILVTLPLWLTLMILITLGIKIYSPGPVFFRQERVGYRGRRFMILKFRSMKVNAETHIHEGHLERLIQTDCPMTKLDAAGDPRLIPYGRIMRAMGLDELPQLINVLRGEMTLVGPRPCTTSEFERYEPWQRKRFDAPPGLTGYWQVNGKNKTTFSEMIAMDIFYAKNMSLWLDLKILSKTAPAILTQVLESRANKSSVTKAAMHSVESIRE